MSYLRSAVRIKFIDNEFGLRMCLFRLQNERIVEVLFVGKGCKWIHFFVNLCMKKKKNLEIWKIGYRIDQFEEK